MEEKGLRNVERGTGHLGGIQENCQSIQGRKVHLELNLTRDSKDKKKGFFQSFPG